MSSPVRFLVLLLVWALSCSCGGGKVVPGQGLSEEEERRILRELEETQQAEGRGERLPADQ